MIINGLTNYFNQCPLISGDTVDVDFLGSTSDCYSIDTIPCDPIIKKYASGGSMKQYCFILAGRKKYGIEKNCNNSVFYEKLAQWIEDKNSKNELPFIGDEKTPQSIEVTNSGYMFEEDVQSAGYHLQCRLIYTENI